MKSADNEARITDDPRPWPWYRLDFLYAEMERYERDEREIYDALCSVPNSPAIPYRNGLLRSFGWFLGDNRSPLFGHPTPPTKDAYVEEYRAAYFMHEDSPLVARGIRTQAQHYGDFEPPYVSAVYRSLKWIKARPTSRPTLVDPLPCR